MYEKVYLKLDGVVRFAFIDKTTLKNVRKMDRQNCYYQKMWQMWINFVNKQANNSNIDSVKTYIDYALWKNLPYFRSF